MNNVKMALNALDAGDLVLVRECLEREKDDQETYPSVLRFCLEDARAAGFDVTGLTTEDASYIAGELVTDALMEDYWLAVDFVMEERYGKEKDDDED